MASNPFAALIQDYGIKRKNDDVKSISKVLENIFEITLNSEFQNEANDSAFIYLGDSDSSGEINVENLDDLLLQRIMLTEADEIDSRLIPKNKSLKHPFNLNQFSYLYNCFIRLSKHKQKFIDLNKLDQFESISSLIVNMCRTILNIFESESDKLSQKFIRFITQESRSELAQYFYTSFINLFDSDRFYESEEKIETLIEDPVELKFLTEIFINFNKSLNFQNFDSYSNDFVVKLDLLRFLTEPKLMKYLFVYTSFLPDSEKSPNRGRLWQTSTLIGKIISPSVLPIDKYKIQNLVGEPQHQFRYFLTPGQMTRQDVEINEKNMHMAQQIINKEINSFFYDHLIRTNSNSKIRNLWLNWVSKCMFDNKSKSQEWSNYNQNPISMFLNQTNPSDGFFMNLLEIFLTYSMPFCANKTTQATKLTKINPYYASSDIKSKSLTILDTETKFIPSRPVSIKLDSNFNFITESFYFTHNLIRLSYLSLYQKLIKLNNELSKWQQTYQDLAQSNDPQMNRIKTMFENMTCEFLNLKSVMTEENLTKKLSKFLFNTSLWLSFVTLKAENSDFGNSETQIKIMTKQDFSLKNTLNFNLDLLSLIPEFFLTNVVEFIIFINRFKETLLPDLFLDRMNRENDPEFLDWYLYLILCFMGRADRLFNPHIRAQLAESIECLLPRKNASMYDFHKFLSEKIFIGHTCADLIGESLISVFVSIEMTGQSVQFEQKFNYRRPMYELIDHLWNLPNNKHRNEIKKLANYAFDNIESAEQPLFLKFLNYLINDANYLLVEGLLYLEKIKISQDKLEADRIEKNLTSQQRAELDSSLKHMIMLAKFHNFMSLKTIETIRMLTGEIKNIFCHSILVDRITTMLNDFLLHLVGKKKRKQLKVKNFEEVEFKPKQVVSVICDIYLNLAENREFCESICRDGRSYSADLFNSAIEVLEQIGRDIDWIEKFKNFFKKIEEISEQLRLEEANFDDAPDEYLDPIMSSLMEDPVILPNSKKIVDRSTISRHLLSDQTDPFNRSPLTLQEVIPASDLKREIEEWKKNKLKK